MTAYPRIQYRILGLLSAVIVLMFGVGASAQSGQSITTCGSYAGNLILQTDLIGDTCLVISGSSSVLNGNGHQIITSGSSVHAVIVTNTKNVTIRNLISNGGVYLTGDDTDSALIEDNTLGGFTNTSGDDDIIRDNILHSLTIGQVGANSAQRNTISGNTITGNQSDLVSFSGSGETTCPPTNHSFSNNVVTATHLCLDEPGSPDQCSAPTALSLWCAAGNTFNGNVIRATGQSRGVNLQDDSDNNRFINNTVAVSAQVYGDFGAVNIVPGTNGRHAPINTTFSFNNIRSEGGLALNLQSPGAGNRFDRNTFWSNSTNPTVKFFDGPNSTGLDHNTFYNAGTGPTLEFDNRIDRVTDQLTNNIFATNGPIAVQLDALTADRYAGDNNLFASSNPVMLFGSSGNLANWQSLYSPDDTSSVFGEPLFVDAINGNFGIQAGSAARGMGSSGTDIGAFAYENLGCTETWTSCTPWSLCVSGSQIRTCTDANNCGTIVSRPPVIQSCISVDVVPPARTSTLTAN